MLVRYSSSWKRKNERIKFWLNSSFASENIEYLSYHNKKFLEKFINRQGFINQSIFNSLSLKYQRMVSTAIKRARIMAILPYNINVQKETMFKFYNNKDNNKKNYNYKTKK